MCKGRVTVPSDHRLNLNARARRLVLGSVHPDRQAWHRFLSVIGPSLGIESRRFRYLGLTLGPTSS